MANCIPDLVGSRRPILTPTSGCSRCGSRWPNAGCYVCSDDPEEEEHPDKCECHECEADRLACRGDYLRDEMIDRQMEEAANDKNSFNEEP
jgi:hypothetical protein